MGACNGCEGGVELGVGSDLTLFSGVETRRLNEAFKRNRTKVRADFRC
jgi:hypothetical protein